MFDKSLLAGVVLFAVALIAAVFGLFVVGSWFDNRFGPYDDSTERTRLFELLGAKEKSK